MNRALKYILLIIVSGIFLFPILWVIISSFKPQSELFTYPLTILPHKATIENYVNAFASGDFITYYANSIFVSVAATLLTITINVMAGYALSKFYFKGRDLIFYIMISTLMIP
ncbi:MAG TPA: carbohydrate ABC transporter permease, partial [Rectinema sp.]|nr:carbohydrate ABC transporter permease [Rectinema sp.]